MANRVVIRQAISLDCYMFLIRTRIGPSQIHGNGVFACEHVAEGTTIWRFEPLFDRVIPEKELLGMPKVFTDFVEMYAYPSSDLDGQLVLPCDHAKFLNHCSNPNTRELPFVSIASREINIDDEITCDYGAFCVGWSGFV